MIEFAYLHIPFCIQKCRYCAFASFVNFNLMTSYIDSLLKQIEKEYDNTPLKTLYFGGGTPSKLQISDVEKIISKFNFIKNPEITFEMNPEDVNENYLKGLLNLGISRVSIGVQTFNDKILKEIGRRHSALDSINAIKLIKNLGFKNVSVDLMYGLPFQTIENLKEDLKIYKSLDIEHISTYGLKIEDKTYFKKFPPKNLPNDDIQADMYLLIKEELKDFTHYEISNFAKSEEYFSKHNLNYWEINPYFGFGLGASGFTGKIRYKNTENLKKYINDPFLKEEEIEISKDELLEEAIFLGFRELKGIDTNNLNKKFNIDFEKKYERILEKYLETGHILRTQNGYKLSTDGILISNNILCDFLC